MQDSVLFGLSGGQSAVEAGDMTEKHLAMRHHQQRQSMKQSGEAETEGPDVVKVMTCSGKNAAMCSKFVYLGSMLTPDATAQGEIRRRAAIAWTVFGDLDRIWKSHTITWKLKGRLFSALVLSIMLYNAQVWPLVKDCTAFLEGIYTRMIKSLYTRATRLKTDSKQTKALHTKKTNLLQLLHLPTMHGLPRQKRMRWGGHALRRVDSDLSKVEVKKELALSLKPWTKYLLGDVKELNIRSLKALEDISKKQGYIVPYKKQRNYTQN
jgi:hypothetical protein